MMPCLWYRLLYLSPHHCIAPLQITSTLCVCVCVCLRMRVCIHLCVCARLWGWVGTGVIITYLLCCADGVGPFKNVISFMISHKKTWLFTNNHTVSDLSLNPHTMKVHSSTCMFVCTQVWAHSNTHTQQQQHTEICAATDVFHFLVLWNSGNEYVFKLSFSDCSQLEFSCCEKHEITTGSSISGVWGVVGMK